jgi:large subunit ribosomal protein L24
MRLKIGDNVKVISGNDKGKFGEITDLTKSLVTVKGINIRTKHIKPATKEKSGEIVQQEAPIHISNIMLCDSENIASRFTVVKTGKIKERFSKKNRKKNRLSL